MARGQPPGGRQRLHAVTMLLTSALQLGTNPAGRSSPLLAKSAEFHWLQATPFVGWQEGQRLAPCAGYFRGGMAHLLCGSSWGRALMTAPGGPFLGQDVALGSAVPTQSRRPSSLALFRATSCTGSSSEHRRAAYGASGHVNSAVTAVFNLGR